jgi:class 3 adenylate cyclase
VKGVKRFELISHLRDQITLMKFGDRDADDRINLGRRIFEFGDAAQVLNNAVNATVLFLDLRGFTQTSEGHISERDLTQELYTVFDAFIPHVRRFGGTVDKVLGDGIMITFGTRRADPLDPLNAVRTAVLCQDTLLRLRQEGQDLLQDGDRHPLRPRLHRALHRGRGVGADDGHRPQREPGRPPQLRGQEAGGRGRRRAGGGPRRRARCT